MASAIPRILRGTAKGFASLVALSAVVLAQPSPDSLSRADDVVTQADVTSFAEGLVGKGVPRPAPTPEQLDQKAQRIAPLASGAARMRA